jgi:hypothetical protein
MKKRIKKIEIERVAKKLGMNIIYNKDSDNDPLYNDCSCTFPDVWIGDYSNDEFELISLFHEYGHYIMGTGIRKNFAAEWKYNTLIIEIECWRLGLEVARNLGYLFSDEAIKFGYEKAMSYVGYDEREVSNWKENYGSKLWINKKRK